jgi:hypothetical protein
MVEIFAIIYTIQCLLKRSKYSRLTSMNYPYLPVEQFEEWRRSELRAIDTFVFIAGPAIALAFCGYFLLGVMMGINGETNKSPMENPGFLAIAGTEIIIIIIAALISSSYQKKAKRIREMLNIIPPP